MVQASTALWGRGSTCQLMNFPVSASNRKIAFICSVWNSPGRPSGSGVPVAMQRGRVPRAGLGAQRDQFAVVAQGCGVPAGVVGMGELHDLLRIDRIGDVEHDRLRAAGADEAVERAADE